MRRTITLAVIALAALAANAVVRAAQPATTHYGTNPKELTLDLGDKVTLKLVQIPAGKFLIGSPETEKGRFKDEALHEVTISGPFYMGITHVTVDQFAAFVKDSGFKTDAETSGSATEIEIKDGTLRTTSVTAGSWRNPGFDQKGNCPVVQVNWNDAHAYCEWLSKKSGKKVSLPTEAQWEYACRAGTKTVYPWGDGPEDGKGWANCGDQSLKQKLPNERDMAFFSWDDGFEFTSPVGSFKPNAFGLYDMIGNAYQWCEDRYGAYENGITDGVATGAYRVVRGGSWLEDPKGGRSALRARHIPGFRLFDIGFRVAVGVE